MGIDLLLAAASAVAAGAVNALAGGGTLISFPTLVALGVPPIAANVTNAVALCPGYLGATFAQRGNLRGQRARLWVLVPAGIAGGLIGGAVLLNTTERTFQALVPYMIQFASFLLAMQERVRALVLRRLSAPYAHHAPVWATLPVFLAGIYGGFFSAGMSVVLLAILGTTLDDALTRLNALKQAVAFSVNVAATVFFLFSDQVLWPFAAVMAIGALIGGAMGGRLAGRMNASTLRWTVVVAGTVIAIFYWVRTRVDS